MSTVSLEFVFDDSKDAYGAELRWRGKPLLHRRDTPVRLLRVVKMIAYGTCNFKRSEYSISAQVHGDTWWSFTGHPRCIEREVELFVERCMEASIYAHG